MNHNYILLVKNKNCIDYKCKNCNLTKCVLNRDNKDIIFFNGYSIRESLIEPSCSERIMEDILK